MSKYIDAEKLISKIVELRKELPDTIEHLNDEESGFARGQQYELTAIETEILCFQQEQTGIEKEAEISPSMVSNFGPCTFDLSVILTQEEIEKMGITPFVTKKTNVIIKDVK